MKNKEKFAKEILDIACSGRSIAVTKDNKVVYCSNISCESCMFDSCGKHIGRSQVCSDRLHEWAESEYVEEPTITSREKNFLDLLLPNYKYIAKDKNGFLLAYTEKPIKILETLGMANCALINMFDIKFDFIKREDEEPWRIEDLKKLEVKDE